MHAPIQHLTNKIGKDEVVPRGGAKEIGVADSGFRGREGVFLVATLDQEREAELLAGVAMLSGDVETSSNVPNGFVDVDPDPDGLQSPQGQGLAAQRCGRGHPLCKLGSQSYGLREGGPIKPLVEECIAATQAALCGYSCPCGHRRRFLLAIVIKAQPRKLATIVHPMGFG